VTLRKKNRAGNFLTRTVRWLAGGAEGAELIEFSFLLPFLLVFLAGVIDFGGAWATKDKLAGAVREGARVAVANFNDTTNPQCSGTPCSVQAAASAVTAYLNSTGVNTCGFDPTTSPPAAGTFTWTYTASGCTNPWTLTIERAVPVASGGSTAMCTRVTLNFPYAWNFGDILGLMVGANGYGTTITLTSSETMTNLN
jgi:Flp pilus assembly protein TadG